MTLIQQLSLSNEKNRLLNIYDAQRRFSHIKQRSIPSRRTSKAKANATGQILKNSRVTSEVGLEKIFNHPSWAK